jgi:hypothetical protein
MKMETERASRERSIRLHVMLALIPWMRFCFKCDGYNIKNLQNVFVQLKALQTLTNADKWNFKLRIL